MAGFDWRAVYPGRRIVTLVLEPAEASELLEQAASDGRMIAPDTVLGMPSIESGSTSDVEPAEPEPDPRIVILPVVRRERLPDTRPAEVPDDGPAEPRFDRRSPLGEKPPHRPAEPKLPDRRYNAARGRWEKRGEITPADLKLVEEAVAKGQVTKCPPATFALDANDPANVSWTRPKAPKGKATTR